MDRELEQQLAAPTGGGIPLAEVTEGNMAETIRLLDTAKSLLADIKAAISSGSPKAARDALDALKSLASGNSVVAPVLAAAVSSDAAIAALAAQEEEGNKAANVLAPLVEVSPFMSRETQQIVMQSMRPDVQDYYNTVLSGDNIGASEMSVTEQGGRMVVSVVKSAAISGDEARAAFTHANFVALPKNERERVGKQIKVDYKAFGAKEAEEFKEKVAILKKIAVDRVNESDESPEDKQAKLLRIQKKFDNVEKLIREVQDADRAAKSGPGFMKAALGGLLEDRKEALSESVRNGVIDSALLQKEKAQGGVIIVEDVELHSPPLNTPSKQLNKLNEGKRGSSAGV